MTHGVCARCGLLTEWQHELESHCIAALRLIVNEMVSKQQSCEIPFDDNQLWGTDDASSKVD